MGAERRYRMTHVRTVLAVILGYAIVAGGLSLIVMTWWVNEWLPLGAPSVVAIGIGLVVVGWLAGFLAAAVAPSTVRVAIYGVAALTFLVLGANIIMDVAVEPLWFKVMAIALVIPAVLPRG